MMKVKVKSWKQLEKEGFKQDFPFCYKGDKKNPDAKIRDVTLKQIQGKEVHIVEIEDADSGLVQVVHKDKLYGVYTWLFEKIPDLSRVKKPLRKLFDFGDDDTTSRVTYNHVNFNFSCDMRTISRKDAITVAKWILKVGKDK